MKGKKTDTNFVANFVVSCVQKGKGTTEEICQEARNQIQLIDDKIKEINNLKLQRAKLQDVLSSFDDLKKDNLKDKLILKFYDVRYKPIAMSIMEYLMSNVKKIDISILMSLVQNSTFSKETVFYTVKELLELQILKKNNEEICPGSNFNIFYEFLMNHFKSNVAT